MNILFKVKIQKIEITEKHRRGKEFEKQPKIKIKEWNEFYSVIVKADA